MHGYKIIVLGIKKILFRVDLFREITDDILNHMFLKEYQQHSKKLKDLYNIHKGDRCFLVATGPSLNKVDFSLLKNEIIFGINSLYRGFDKLGIKCDYYAISDGHRWDTDSEGIMSINSTIFLLYIASRHYLRSKKRYDTQPILVKGNKSILRLKKFPENISKSIYVGGASVVILCLQVLFYLGFKEVYLVGTDCSYSGQGHFDGKKDSSVKWTSNSEKKHWSTVFDAYKVCKDVFESDGRKIYNATVGGNLEVFERRKLEEL